MSSVQDHNAKKPSMIHSKENNVSLEKDMEASRYFTFLAMKYRVLCITELYMLVRQVTHIPLLKAAQHWKSVSSIS